MIQAKQLTPIVALTLLTLAVVGHSADTDGFRATAVFNGAQKASYESPALPNKMAASTHALSSCQRTHTSAPDQCELTHLAGNKLTTTADIKAQLPKGPHPLFLWQMSSATATVYLAGSVHILKSGLYPLASPYQAAFDRANVLVVEVDLSTFTPQQMQFKAMQYGMLQNDKTLREVLSEDNYIKLEVATRQLGLPLSQMGQFKPSFISQQLAVLSLISSGYDPNAGIEAHFTQQKAQREVLQLETIDFQLDLLMNQPMAVQAQLLQETIEQMGEFEPLTAQLITAYLSGDIEAFENVFNTQSGTSPETKEFMRQLMDVRNVGMAEKITAYLATDETYFVLIGAGHFVGNNNILELLANNDIIGKRIASDAQL